ncbi:MAG: endonuclease NucS [Chloroflexota bacterium]|nr:endonuclease NucS [Chloroflexota bacterium]
MLYRMSKSKDRFQEIDRTSLGTEGVLERQDLQRIIRDQPDVIENGLFIVAEEFSNWADSGRSIDLLGIGEDRNLVVVELKRGDTGEHMELQAIRYAAMAANMTLEQIVDAHRQYLQERGVSEDAQELIHQFLDVGDGVTEPQVATERPRILLVSEGFSKELTTSVLWLNDVGLDIRCVRLRVYRHQDELLIDVDQVIPLPEAHDYLVKVRDRAEESQQQRTTGRMVAGDADFEASIANAPGEHQPNLRKLLQWARSIEESGYTRLSTYHWKGETGLSLIPHVHSENAGLVTIYNDRGRPGIQLWRSVFERRAPGVMDALEKALTPVRLGQGTVTKDFNDHVIELLTQAYKEANSPQATKQE